MHEHLNERGAFVKSRTGSICIYICFVPDATPLQHLSFFGLFMRWVGIFSLSPTRVECVARVVGRNVSCFKPPNQGAVHDMRLNPSKTRVAFLSDVVP